MVHTPPRLHHRFPSPMAGSVIPGDGSIWAVLTVPTGPALAGASPGPRSPPAAPSTSVAAYGTIFPTDRGDVRSDRERDDPLRRCVGVAGSGPRQASSTLSRASRGGGAGGDAFPRAAGFRGQPGNAVDPGAVHRDGGKASVGERVKGA